MSGIGLKLAALFIRQVSRPIANGLKMQATQHESFKRFCISIAQRLHKTDVNLRMKLLGQKGAKVRPLNDKKAIENGATFLSEGFIFTVAGAVVLFESYRQRQKELTRRENVADDIKTLQCEIEYLKNKLEEYDVKLDDFVPPKDINPLVLKVDDNGKVVLADDKESELIKKKAKEAITQGDTKTGTTSAIQTSKEDAETDAKTPEKK